LADFLPKIDGVNSCRNKLNAKNVVNYHIKGAIEPTAHPSAMITAKERKAETEAFLQARGYPVNPFLPQREELSALRIASSLLAPRSPFGVAV